MESHSASTLVQNQSSSRIRKEKDKKSLLDVIASQEIPYIQVTHIVTELKSKVRVPGLSDNPMMSRKIIGQL